MNKTLPGARWSCQSCGACCKGFSFGPIEPHIIEGLKEKDIASVWEPARTQKEWYVQHPKTGAYFFTHIDGHCIFLQEDNRCAIHARWGSKAKPWFCREYPFHVVEDEEGYNITIREDCGGAHKSFQSGQLINEQLEELFAIDRIVPRQKFAMDKVVILPGLGVSTGNWLQVEPVLIESCTQNLQASIRLLRQKLFSMASRQGPDSNETMFQQRCTQLKAFFCAQIAQLDVPKGMTEAKARLCQVLQKDIAYASDDAEVEHYFVYVLKNRILGKSFARLGGFPEGLGLLLLEHAMFAHTGTLSEVGREYSQWRRALMLQPFWNIIRGGAQGLVHLFMLV